MQKNQFSVANILYVTTSFALAMAYAKSIGEAALLQLVFYMIAGICGGVLAGLCVGDMQDTIFWASLTNLLVFLAVAGGRLPSEAVVYAWGIVGAVCGAIGGAKFPNSVGRRCVVMCVMAVGCMSLSLFVLGQEIKGLIWFDVGCAALIGCVLCVGIMSLQKFESESGQSRFAMATWLSGCILLGNVLVPIIGQVQR